jgi:hypothetical protein
MKVQGTWMAAALALALGAPLTGARAQVAPTSANQATADAVAAALRGNPALASNARIAIEARQGVVTLGGVVPSAPLKTEAVARARRVAGVSAVEDRLVVGDARVVPAQFNTGRVAAMGQPTRLALGGLHGHGGGAMGGPMLDGGMIDGGMGAPGGGMMGADAYNGPLPEGPAVPGATQAAVPGYPNYAWPSYAPYPNFSAVGYPTVYPWQAWPNIGPFYPYPEVPLDWRAVTLRWDDGLWWLDFKKHYTRPFFTPYPFGLFAY